MMQATHSNICSATGSDVETQSKPALSNLKKVSALMPVVAISVA
jgi:hypothetical protein